MVSQSKRFPYDTKRLKLAVYGTDHPPIGLQTICMVREAGRLAQNLSELKKWFPNGFGALARDVRSW